MQDKGVTMTGKWGQSLLQSLDTCWSSTVWKTGVESRDRKCLRKVLSICGLDAKGRPSAKNVRMLTYADEC
jgi:hypothetical protein